MSLGSIFPCAGAKEEDLSGRILPVSTLGCRLTVGACSGCHPEMLSLYPVPVAL